jgi:hypothetical protein
MNRHTLHDAAACPELKDWAQACPEGLFSGTCRVETQHATYLFRNGRCFAVSRRGPGGGTTSATMVGLKIAGWLLPDDAEREDEGEPTGERDRRIRVSRSFRPGARAVLQGKTRLFGRLTMVLTSPVGTFTSYGDGVAPQRDRSVNPSNAGSLTRVEISAPALV